MKRIVKKYEGRRKNGSEMPQNNCGRLLSSFKPLCKRDALGVEFLEFKKHIKRDRDLGRGELKKTRH
ncbi:MAG: hypothetical protein SAJ11_17715 [Jaaginema sp. PMC 1078.18]|nr:hypothetical protein [Jaaginema sp. PMC 1078.18]